ncbi:hypothetical protein W911_10500 [Hyphomicrobium nitrativorans NL23]|uniref:Uncharacterized protein n=1 Tax=Hyphomicrobium nitrativorans NL23 TaxID=1029756 RepID=V5SI21_9HYPH|nr:hypothetical protein W911_10500 [Hyphomicrobium nitrativorans NL23]
MPLLQGLLRTRSSMHHTSRSVRKPIVSIDCLETRHTIDDAMNAQLSMHQ